MIRKEKLPGRNTKCPCGSGKKAKRCCLGKIKMFAALPVHIRQQIAVDRILQQSPMVAATGQVLGGIVTTDDTIIIPIESDQVIAIAEPLPETADGPSGSYDFSCNGVEGQ